MKSKVIIGVPLSLIAVVMVFNYINSPPVGFENILGSYDVVGGPFEGCLTLEQPGAGIKVNAVLKGKDSLAGQVDGSIFNFNYSIAGHSGSASLNIEQPSIAGKWSGIDKDAKVEAGNWIFTKRDLACTI